jgi:predicted dehydrogenase
LKSHRIAVIGAGMIAAWHVKAIAGLPNAELAGVCDHGSGKGEAIGPRCGCEAGVCELERFIAREDVDVVAVATPSGVHGEAAELAARHGKHCIVEKPIEIGLERIDRMVEAHRRAGTLLGGIFNLRFTPAARALKAAVEQGRFGRLTFGLAYLPWWREQDYYDKGGWRGTLALDGGGAFMNQGIHTLDLLLWLMGPVREVSAFTATVAHQRIEVEDVGAAAIRFENGALGSIACTTAMWPGHFRLVEIGGTTGTVSMADDGFLQWRFQEETSEDDAIRRDFRAQPAGAGEDSRGASSPSSGFSVEAHQANLAQFLDAVERGERPPIDGSEARKAVRLILAIYQSARDGGRAVSLD